MASARARRYARAIFELAGEKGDREVDAWVRRLEAVSAVLMDPAAVRVFSSPAVPSSRRVELMDGLRTEAMGPGGLNLARLLVAAGRPALIQEIIEEYGALADGAAGRVRATATTAVELDNRDSERIAKELSARLGKEVRLELRVDPAIVGGMVLQVGDRLIDASVATRLQQLRRRLATA